MLACFTCHVGSSSEKMNPECHCQVVKPNELQQDCIASPCLVFVFLSVYCFFCHRFCHLLWSPCKAKFLFVTIFWARKGHEKEGKWQNLWKVLLDEVCALFTPPVWMNIFDYMSSVKHKHEKKQNLRTFSGYRLMDSFLFPIDHLFCRWNPNY